MNLSLRGIFSPERLVRVPAISSPMFVFILALFSPSLILAEQDSPGFGRLFTVPTERVRLDELRQHQSDGTKPVSIDFESIELDVREPKVELPEEVRFSGYIHKQDGSQVLWIDGLSNLTHPQSPRTAVFLNHEKSTAMFETGGQNAVLKPGQVWLPRSGQVEENYHRPTLKTEVVNAVEPLTDGLSSGGLEAASMPKVGSAVETAQANVDSDAAIDVKGVSAMLQGVLPFFNGSELKESELNKLKLKGLELNGLEKDGLNELDVLKGLDSLQDRDSSSIPSELDGTNRSLNP